MFAKETSNKKIINKCRPEEVLASDLQLVDLYIKSFQFVLEGFLMINSFLSKMEVAENYQCKNSISLR